MSGQSYTSIGLVWFIWTVKFCLEKVFFIYYLKSTNLTCLFIAICAEQDKNGDLKMVTVKINNLGP